MGTNRRPILATGLYALTIDRTLNHRLSTLQAQQFDVIICGLGSAGLCTTLWLVRCGISFKILERRNGPLQMGQADSVQCRTVEISESFGLLEDLLKESYHGREAALDKVS